jgi:hypothetical protein
MALGYLDAGSGSMLVGAAAAGFAGVATVGRVAWSKVSPRKRRKGADKDDDATTEEPDAGDEPTAEASSEVETSG